MSTRRRIPFLVVTLAAAAVALTAIAQTTTYQVKEGEVIAVDGNNLVVRTVEGYRKIAVPEGFRFQLEGREVSVHDLKPGMKLTAAIATTRTPVEVVTTELRNAEVINATGMSVVVKDQNGENKIFNEKDFKEMGLAIYKNGEPATAFDLRKGDRITALIMKEGPPVVLEETRVAAVAQPAPPPARAVPTAVAAPAPATAEPAAAEPPRKTLPKTASPWPLVGATGAALLALGAAATLLRRFAR